jgi:DNA-directed RNA polymerase subunit beta
MQSLGLNVAVLDQHGEEIDLKQTFDDDDDFVPASSEINDEGNYTASNSGFGDGYVGEDENGELSSLDDYSDESDDDDDDDYSYDDDDFDDDGDFFGSDDE